MAAPRDERSDIEDIPDDERAMVVRLENDVRVPEDLRYEYERWENLRTYVHTTGQAKDTKTAVATNFMLRSQMATTANLYPRDPAAVIEPEEWIPAQEDPEVAAQMQLAQQQAQLTGQPPPPMPDPLATYPPEWLNYIKAQQKIVNKQIEQGGLKQVIRGQIQDAQTLPISWIKVRFIDDYTRDPLGFRREIDNDVAIRRYDVLKQLYDEDGFIDEDSRWFEMHQLNRQLKDRLIEDMTVDLSTNPMELGLDAAGNPVMPDPREGQLRDLQGEELLPVGSVPTSPHYQGYAFDGLDSEDMRHDWAVTRPEDMRFAWWMAHRVFMRPNELPERWDLTEEETNTLQRDATLFNADGSEHRVGETETKAGESERRKTDRYIEDQNRGKFVAVWEYWDRRQMRVYRWVQGWGRLLDNWEVKDGPKCFFPFVPLQLNRNTGKLFANSDVDLLRPIQEEINTLRTHDNEARRASYPRYMTAKGLLSPSNKRQMRAAIPYSVIEVERADDIQNKIFPLVPATYDPRLYDGSRARRDWEAMSGQSQSTLGITGGSDSATEAAIANKEVGVQRDSRQDLIIENMSHIVTMMVQMNAQRMSEETAKFIAGPGTVWLGSQLEREQVVENFNISVRAVPNSQAERQAKLKDWIDAGTLVSSLGLPINRIEVLKEILPLIGIRTNLSRFIDLNALMAPPPQPAAVDGAPAGGRPDQQGGEGAAGGRPETTENDTPTPESMPNAPQI